jgi:hypothetical protein
MAGEILERRSVVSIERRLRKLETISQPQDKTIHLVWGNPDEPGVYRLGTSGEHTGPPMTKDEVEATIPGGTIIFVDYEQRETMRGEV